MWLYIGLDNPLAHLLDRSQTLYVGADEEPHFLLIIKLSDEPQPPHCPFCPACFVFLFSVIHPLQFVWTIITRNHSPGCMLFSFRKSVGGDKIKKNVWRFKDERPSASNRLIPFLKIGQGSWDQHSLFTAAAHNTCTALGPNHLSRTVSGVWRLLYERYIKGESF